MTFQGKVVFLGFGCVGQAVLPLLLSELKILPERIVILSKTLAEKEVAEKFCVHFEVTKIEKDNYSEVLGPHLEEGSFLLNLSTGVSSRDLVTFCQEKNALYLDASTEPWEGFYTDTRLAPEMRTNFALREEMLRVEKTGPTAVLTHGANPGLVSHFLKQALLHLAADHHLLEDVPSTQEEWAMLAQSLGIKAIHIAERDTQISSKIKEDNTFFNTWSIDGLISESLQPSEMTWGTHERHWPKDAKMYPQDARGAIYLNCPGASVLVRTWTPSGPTHGHLITHAEAISIGEYLTIRKGSEIIYCPTVHYAYSAAPQTLLSLSELRVREYSPQENAHLMLGDVTGGTDELGVLLMGHERGAYWFGSILSVNEAKALVPYNNATSLQVAAGVFAAMKWAILHPREGIVEPEALDHETILKFASPYLGSVKGFYTTWTPLDGRNHLFTECLDEEDPWQFLNMRVC